MSRGYRPLLRHGRDRHLPSRAGFSRREVLRWGLASAVAATVVPGVTGCRSGGGGGRQADANRIDAKGIRVVVIGAGFAGLACALALKDGGADVTVLEHQPRPGGRVVTDRNFVPGHAIEIGGEWVGANHPTWLLLAKRFDIDFADAPEYEGTEPLILDGKALSTEQADAIFEEIDAALARVLELAREIDPVRPYRSPRAAELDARSVADFIAEQPMGDEAKRLMRAIEEADNGVPAERMSLLAYLSMVSGGGFEDYYELSEAYRVPAGNDTLARKLADELGDRVRYEQPVTRIAREADGATVQTRSGESLACDAVVLAIPPSVWGEVEVSPALPPNRAPQMGHNVKLLLSLRSPVWLDAEATPELTSNGELVQLSWEGTKRAVTQGPAALTLFSGAAAADRLRALEAPERARQAIAEVSVVYPNLGDAVTGDKFADWPSVPTARGSYSFPAPGQVTSQGPMLVDGLTSEGVAPLAFAGEHTSYGFAGYMEGALSSGIRAARTIAEARRAQRAPTAVG